MLKKDFIQRQLEEFGKVMAVILNFKKNKDWENFEKELNLASIKYSLYELNKIEEMSLNDFKINVLGKTNTTNDEQKIMADLMFEKMNYYFETNEIEKAEMLKDKCILLYTFYKENLTLTEFNLDLHYKLQVLNKMK